MADWLMKVIKAEAARLLELAEEDAELRADLRALAQKILSATVDREPAADPSAPSTPMMAREPADPSQSPEPRRELTLGRSFPSGSESTAESGPLKPIEPAHDGIDAIAARCRWKSEAARSVAERLRRHREGNDFPVEDPAIDRDVIEWSKWLTDCFYWSAAANDAPVADVSPLDDLGGCLEVVAAALSLVQGREGGRSGDPKGLDRALPLIGEAQSALRAAFQRLGVAADPDQVEVFEWVKTTAARRHIYLKRYMRVDDVAEAARWPERLARIELVDTGRLPRRRNDATPCKPSITHEPTAEVREAGRLLAGRSVVLIGGKRHREAQESLRKSLGLRDLVWIETKEHQAVATFEPMIVRPDVALVLLAIRWSSHAFGDVKELCDRHCKPLARLPGGYSPNQVASQILSQCSDQLEPA